jgi:hypothetical protein
MDGTLLDRQYDNIFFEEELPRRQGGGQHEACQFPHIFSPKQ